MKKLKPVHEMDRDLIKEMFVEPHKLIFPASMTREQADKIQNDKAENEIVAVAIIRRENGHMKVDIHDRLLAAFVSGYRMDNDDKVKNLRFARQLQGFEIDWGVPPLVESLRKKENVLSRLLG